MSSPNGGIAGLSTDELRAAIRAVLSDVLPAAVVAPRTAGDAGRGSVQPVALRSDADLDAFVRRVAALCDDPAQRTALKNGKGRFVLDTATTTTTGTAAVRPLDTGSRLPGPGPGSTAGAVVRVDRGAVTERTVKKAAAESARLVVGARAVLTPLARERARALGVPVEREER